jgi:hypothetical protein
MELSNKAIDADYRSQAYLVAEIGGRAPPEPLREGTVTFAAPPPSFATLREHDEALRTAFMNGWSTGTAPTSSEASKVLWSWRNDDAHRIR